MFFSVDSGTGTSTTSNLPLKLSTSGIYSKGTSSNNQSTYLSREHQLSNPDISDSIVFGDASQVPSRAIFSADNKRSEKSDSIVFRDQSASNLIQDHSESIEFKERSSSRAFEERSDSIVFQNSASNSRSANFVLPMHRKSLDIQTDASQNLTSLRSRSVTFSNFDDVESEDNAAGMTSGDGKDERPSYLYIQMQLCCDKTLKEWLIAKSNRSNVMPLFTQVSRRKNNCQKI